MRRNLTRIQDYFEQTLLRYLPDEFKHHFRMTRETCELLSNANRTNTNDKFVWRPVIAPQKQILAFLWRIAYQEPARAVADRFDLTSSNVDRVFRRVVQATVSLCGQYIKWPTVESRQANKRTCFIILFRIRVKITWLMYHFKCKKFTGNQMQDIKSPFEEEGGFPGVIGVVDGTDVGPLNTNQRPTSTESSSTQ